MPADEKPGVSSVPAPSARVAVSGARVGVGDEAPDFERSDSQGRPFRLSQMRGRCVVLFFFPKSFTPACTAQSCAFRDAYEDFARAGAEVVGVSSDAGTTHQSFAQRFTLPFRLLPDLDGSLRRLLGVPRTLWMIPGRVTYVIGPDGVVRHVFNSQLNVKRHVASALETVRSLSGAPGAK
jgi:peroxiredoxin Q/BCP